MIKSNFNKTLTTALLIGLLTSTTAMHVNAQDDQANTDATNIDVTPEQSGVTQEELAAIYVLSELCSNYGYKKDPAYRNGFEQLVKENMPGIQKPLNALEMRAKQKDFKPFLDQARLDAKNAGEQQNKEICQEISTLNKAS